MTMEDNSPGDIGEAHEKRDARETSKKSEQHDARIPRKVQWASKLEETETESEETRRHHLDEQGLNVCIRFAVHDRN